MMRITKKGFVTVVVLGLVVGWLTAVDLTNPPVEVTLNWQDEEAEALFQRACMDCHSHETNWPWYSHIAPVYWYMNRNITEAREHFNVSVDQWGDAEEAAHMVREGEMPPGEYLFLHPDARLTKNESEKLADGMNEMFGSIDQEERQERRKEDRAEAAEERARREAGDGGGEEPDHR